MESVLRDVDHPVLVVFDVDGTLAPIVPRPDRARIPAATLRLLGLAARARNVAVAVLSARTRRDLARMVPVRGVRRVAQYGIGSVVGVSARRRSAWRRSAEALATRLTSVAEGRRPAYVERKGVTVALHDRGVSPGTLRSIRLALRPVEAAARALEFTPVRGTRVTEFIPRGHGKARGLRALLDKRGAFAARTVFYWGDSEADEPAFAALGRRHLSIKVGPGPTRAGHRVDGPRDAARLLASVVNFRGRTKKTRGR